ARQAIENEIEDKYRHLANVRHNPHRLQEIMGRQQRISRIRRTGSVRTAASLESIVSAAMLRIIERESLRDQLKADLEGLDTESMKVTRARLKAVESEAATLRSALTEAEDDLAVKERQAKALRRALEKSATSARQVK